MIQSAVAAPCQTIEAVDDQALVRRAQAGDPEAVAELFQRHNHAIYRYFYIRIQDHNIAEDLAGEVFLQVVESLPRYTDRGRIFAAWLFRIARHRLIDYYRRVRMVRVAGESTLPPEAHSEGSEATVIRRLEYRLLHTRIGELTDEQKLVVQLRFFEGYTLNTTAAIMDKSATAIKALQHRALRQLAVKITL